MSRMRIFICIQDGGELVAQVATYTLIRDLKHRIEGHIKVPPERQVLLFRFRELEDDKRFHEYPEIRERAKLQLQIKPSSADLEDSDNDDKSTPSKMSNGHSNGYHHGISDLETVGYIPLSDEDKIPNWDDLMNIVNREMNVRRSKRQHKPAVKFQSR